MCSTSNEEDGKKDVNLFKLFIVRSLVAELIADRKSLSAIWTETVTPWHYTLTRTVLPNSSIPIFVIL